MLYDRKIKYLDYYERGERVKGCGFAKLEIRESELKLELNVRGLHPTDSFSRDVVLKSTEAEIVLGQITLQNGSGSFNYTCRLEEGIGNAGISCGEIREIRVSVGGSRELCCSWEKTPERTAEKSLPAVPEPAEENRETEDQDEVLDRESQVLVQPEQSEELPAEQAAQDLEASQTGKYVLEADMPQEISELQAVSEQPQPEENRSDRKPPVKLMENKWQQLSAIYPHIRPFGDDRDYLSLSPSDFVLFPAKYYKAANNSFLLHGYYNYKHLILTRVEYRNDVMYYLGVPGNYYDREKQVAVMFGFESFECAKEPAQTGDFGYYMMRMEL